MKKISVRYRMDTTGRRLFEFEPPYPGLTHPLDVPARLTLICKIRQHPIGWIVNQPDRTVAALQRQGRTRDMAAEYPPGWRVNDEGDHEEGMLEFPGLVPATFKTYCGQCRRWHEVRRDDVVQALANRHKRLHVTTP